MNFFQYSDSEGNQVKLSTLALWSGSAAVLYSYYHATGPPDPVFKGEHYNGSYKHKRCNEQLINRIGFISVMQSFPSCISRKDKHKLIPASPVWNVFLFWRVREHVKYL